MWTLQDGLVLVTKIETLLIPERAHCALGGSVLHSGSSSKDLDVFIYPHDNGAKYTTEQIAKALASLCDKPIDTSDHEDQYQRIVYKMQHNGKRVDLFFLS